MAEELVTLYSVLLAPTLALKINIFPLIILFFCAPQFTFVVVMYSWFWYLYGPHLVLEEWEVQEGLSRLREVSQHSLLFIY